MKLFRSAALFLCITLSAAFAPAAAAGSQPSQPVTQYAAELSQRTGLKYFKSENTQRYIDYKTIHPDYSWETVLTYVNIGLDTYFYTNPVVPADPGAVDVLVNKYHPLPPDFIPAHLETISAHYSSGTRQLTHAARVAFEKMCADAKKLGYSIYATSAYRSYSRQQSVYSSFLDPGDPSSAAAQELLAARPGYSEHQTGLAVDVIRANAALMNTAVYKWYAKNAHKYGFIIRYPYAKEPILGYTNEPWHLRYLGVRLATAVYNSGLTYDEYYAREIDVPAKGADALAVGVTSSSAVTAGGRTAQLATYDVLGATYYKLRDFAAVLNGTEMQFDIVWDDAARRIVLLYGEAYSGQAPPAAFEPGRAAPLTAVSAGFYTAGASFDMASYASGGSTYYTLGDILQMLGLTATDDGHGGLILSPAAA
ncbi:LD-carboxypeptidase LdcB, LAS superfamily [Sporobacter termitidis DSM 10068]|uniref:LD-carboxypeptidase LdcB, LAS superfamily n=1 Tax=Sporobacter termitidis DSM 10068 TaxID=1123282 RepID=A0A1M5WL83_9FIRM|nr:M15 family metallopeptidase [Sporobacter termitidis]SHH88202.1 LD-carboxypeptidase LdcB, LAS superfamily [Sporobacter termitidis DSM 10068]